MSVGYIAIGQNGVSYKCTFHASTYLVPLADRRPIISRGSVWSRRERTLNRTRVLVEYFFHKQSHRIENLSAFISYKSIPPPMDGSSLNPHRARSLVPPSPSATTSKFIKNSTSSRWPLSLSSSAVPGEAGDRVGVSFPEFDHIVLGTRIKLVTRVRGNFSKRYCIAELHSLGFTSHGSVRMPRKCFIVGYRSSIIFVC